MAGLGGVKTQSFDEGAVLDGVKTRSFEKNQAPVRLISTGGGCGKYRMADGDLPTSMRTRARCEDNGMGSIFSEGHPRAGRLVAGSWNVKGLTEEKLHCLCRYMVMYNIGILCLQETRAPKADYYYNDDGFWIILSGTDEGKSWAGVGFIIAPWLAARVTSFLQFSDCLASLKFKTRRG